jgi:hypothetical protein
MRLHLSTTTAALCAIAGMTLLSGCGGSGAQVGANEAKIPGLLRSYAAAQSAYHRHDFDKDKMMEYSDSLTVLVKDLKAFVKGTKEKPFLSDAFGAAHGENGKPLHGYLFKECKEIRGEGGPGQKIDWVNDYALCATPAKYGETGKRTFVINTNGQVWAKDLGKGELLSGYPMSPKGQGWQKAN